MAASPPPLLDLNKLVERPRIAIDGQLYDLAAPAELSVIDRHRVTSKCRRFEHLMQKDQLDELEEIELDAQLRGASEIVLKHVPHDVIDKLNDDQLLQVLEVFSMLSLRNRLKSAAAAIGNRTGESLSPGSNGSTEATRDGG